MAYFDKYGVEYSDDRKTLVRCPRDYQGKYEIPNYVTDIGENAFSECAGLTSVIISYSVRTIGARAFYNCVGLVGLVAFYSVNRVGRDAFYGCTGLTQPLCFASVFAYMPTSFAGEYIMPDGVETIAEGAFRNCTKLTRLVMPNSVKSIGNATFSGCSNLTEINISNRISEIGNYAFYGCSSLKGLTIPNSVTSIGNYAFASSGFTSIELPSSVISIGDACFSLCQNLEAVTFNGAKHGMKYIGDFMFDRCNNLKSLHVNDDKSNLSTQDRKDGNYCLYSRDGILYCNVPAKRSGSGYGIGAWSLRWNILVAFPSQKELSFFQIPEYVDEIQSKAFGRCKYLKSIRLDRHIIKIHTLAFAFMGPEIIIPVDSKDQFAKIKELSNVINKLKEEDFSISADGKELMRYSPSIDGNYIIPNGIEIIKSKAFFGCILSSITVPRSVKNIENGAFERCGNLTAIIVDEDNPYFCSLDGVLYNKDKTILIQCPERKTLQCIPDSVIQITPNALDYCQLMGVAKERVIAIRQEAQRKREQEEREKKLLEEKAREEAKRIAEEKEIQRRNQEREAREQEQLQAQQLQRMLKDSILFFDTETTGVPKLYNAPVTNSANWPRLVQLAWLMADKNGNILKRNSVIIKPDGFSIPSDASAVHGITTERAQREGKPLDAVLEEFMNDVQLASSVVGHNIDFDMHIVGAELYRLGMDYNLLMNKPCTCTMKSSTDFCAIPNPNSYYGGYKWPSLQELYRKLFNRDFADAHDALADIMATKECFFELKRREII